LPSSAVFSSSGIPKLKSSRGKKKITDPNQVIFDTPSKISGNQRSIIDQGQLLVPSIESSRMISPTTPKKLTGKKRNLFEDSPTENIQSHQLQREFEERKLELEREYKLKKKELEETFSRLEKK
jgi:hypothetical protein